MLLFSHSIVSNSLQLHKLQHVRLPYPSASPGDCSNSCIYINTHIFCIIISSSVDGHFECFHILALVNNAIMNMTAKISVQTPIFTSFRYISRSRIQDPIVILF